MISSDQRSPITSSEALTGQPERRFDFGFGGIGGDDNKYSLQNASDIVRASVTLEPGVGAGDYRLDRQLVLSLIRRR